jgi:hypothetical protein
MEARMPPELELVPLCITNPNTKWVVAELDRLIAEWNAWKEDVDKIEDHPYDHQGQSDVFKDGEANMKKHRLLQAKTLTFLNNNIEGHGFITGIDGNHIDRTDLRLRIRVKHRIDSLDELRARLAYARVPEAYWKAKGKELVDKVISTTPDKAIEIAAGYLKDG